MHPGLAVERRLDLGLTPSTAGAAVQRLIAAATATAAVGAAVTVAAADFAGASARHVIRLVVSETARAEDM